MVVGDHLSVATATVWLMEWLIFLGGAAVAAVINLGFNVLKLVLDRRDERSRRKRDRKDEHARWLREKRLEAYVDFFEGTRLVLNLADIQGRAIPKLDDHSELDDAQHRLKGSPILLVAPDGLRDLTQSIRDQVDKYVDTALDEDLSDESRDDALDKLGTNLVADRLELARLCREDLGSLQRGEEAD